MVHQQPSAEAEEARREFVAWLGRAHARPQMNRSAARNAPFFLPHLRPGMRLLDAGCGGGSITVGLAAAVAPGDVVGIDNPASAIAAARAFAAEHEQANVTFEQADILGLPFPPESFDAVFVHATLQHIDQPVRALRQLFRVLRPGGVIGLADADYGGSVIAPSTPALRRALRLMLKVRGASGGDLHAGSRLRHYLHQAGFERATASASAQCEGTAENAGATGAFWAAYFGAPELVRFVTATGIATAAQAAEASVAWREWGRHPGAYWARFWCQAIAFKPG